MESEIRLTSNRSATIIFHNGDEYRIELVANGIMVTKVSWDDKSIIARPVVTNQLFVTSIDLTPNQ